MPITRKFVDWSQPALPAIVDDLRREYTVLGTCDLSGVLAVFPGQQAGRRFLELLASRTGGQVSPPRIITVGQLPEFLYEPKRPFASPLTQRLAWAEALRALPSSELQILISQPPGEHDVDAWLNLGEMLSKQHRELAADLLDFDDVAQRGASLPDFNETERWQILAKVQKFYLELLDSFELWDQQTARLVAIEQAECHTNRNIVLVGTVDMNQTMRSMLDQVGHRVTAYVHAPQKLKSRFDEHGCLIPATWDETPIEIDEEQIHVVEGPGEQANAVARILHKCSERYAIDDFTVSVPDDRIVPHLRRTLHQFDVPTNWIIGGHIPETRPYRLLLTIADYLESERIDRFASLIRQPDISAWIDQHGLRSDWLTMWDAYQCERLQQTTAEIIGNSDSSKTAAEIKGVVHALLEPLQGDARTLADWAEPIVDLLLKVYGTRELDREDPTDQILIDACRKIQQACVEHTSLPEQLLPVVSAPQAIQLTLEQIRSEIIPVHATEDAIQLFGWLDMPLDDAPVAMVTSFNEGYIPSSVNHDLFLPNQLRVHLGIEDNQRRYARDAYALSVLMNSRKETHLIVGKRDVKGEPQKPSRLLFATKPKQIAERIVRFYDPEKQSVETFEPPLRAGMEQSGFTIPRPEPPPKPKRSFSVTEFREYLKSPYRYYLRYVLRLSELSDDVAEMDPMAFGNLIHDVLNEFGESQVKDSIDHREINQYLRETLDAIVLQKYGTQPLYPVTIQVEQAHARLAAWAQWQASWRTQGWEIRFVEVGGRESIKFPLDDQRNIFIRGRIDRIDFNARTGQWVILDYKTGDSGQHPERVHRRYKQWIDLQLPLYRHLAKPLQVMGDVQLGYVVIPRDTNEVGALLANWSEEELLEADAVVRDTARKILDEEFWQEIDRKLFPNEFDGICQTHVFGKEALV